MNKMSETRLTAWITFPASVNCRSTSAWARRQVSIGRIGLNIIRFKSIFLLARHERRLAATVTYLFASAPRVALLDTARQRSSELSEDRADPRTATLVVRASSEPDVCDVATRFDSHGEDRLGLGCSLIPGVGSSSP